MVGLLLIKFINLKSTILESLNIKGMIRIGSKIKVNSLSSPFLTVVNVIPPKIYVIDRDGKEWFVFNSSIVINK